MTPKLQRITEKARKEPRLQFTALAHLLDEEFLRACYQELNRQGASGVDGVTVAGYGEGLEENLRDLVARLKRRSYRPQAVRRVYIPKGDGKQRPLGIPTVEDRVVQLAIKKILEAIWEPEFAENSYGFRPGKSAHQALKALDGALMTQGIEWVVDADIEKFFDSVDHDSLMKCLKRRIGDPVLLRLIARFLKAGVMEAGEWEPTEKGTPQGGNLSPLLANIYLHYALDRWLATQVKPGLRGKGFLVRYADDLVVGFTEGEEAQWFLEAFRQRMAACGLRISETKSRIVEFGRRAWARWRGGGKRPGSFNFLGFTHYCDTTRKGAYKVGRKTDRRRMNRSLKAVNQWLRENRNRCKLVEWWPKLVQKIRGHYRYYGVSGNFPSLRYYHSRVYRLARKWINRRSQKGRFTVERFNRFLAYHPLPAPRIHYDLYRFSPGV